MKQLLKVSLLLLMTVFFINNCTKDKKDQQAKTPDKKETAVAQKQETKADSVKADQSTDKAKKTKGVKNPFKDIVNTEEMKKIVDEGKAVIIDSRGTIFYQNLHIKGAIDISSKYMKKKLNMLPKDKSTLLVFYCGGLECEKSHKAAHFAVKKGYKNVKVYGEGMPAWVKAKYPTDGKFKAPKVKIPVISADDVKKLIKSEKDKLFLLDVRSESQAKGKAVKEFTYIPSDDLHTKIDEVLAKGKDKKVIILCHTGKIANTAAQIFKAKGLKDVVLVKGGYKNGWAKSAKQKAEKKKDDSKNEKKTDKKEPVIETPADEGC